MKYRVAKVAKTLAAVSALVDAGSTVVFGKESYILHHRTGTKTALRRENGVHLLDTWVLSPEAGGKLASVEETSGKSTVSNNSSSRKNAMKSFQVTWGGAEEKTFEASGTMKSFRRQGQ